MEDSIERWPLTPDIIESLNDIQEAGNGQLDDIQPFFDPTMFTQNNPAPSRIEFELDEDELIHWAIESSTIRS